MNPSIVHNDDRAVRHTLIHPVEEAFDETKEAPFGEGTFDNHCVDHASRR